MIEQIYIDDKLKQLIRLCKETSNYKKLAYVGFILIANKVEEIVVRLGVRFRDKKQDEKLYAYMELVNKVFYDNLKIEIFEKDAVQMVRTVELLLEKAETDIFKDYVKGLFNTYYELRKFEVPDITHHIQEADVYAHKPMALFSALSTTHEKKRKQGALHSMLVQKLSQEEKTLRDQLKYEFKKDTFESLLQVKSIKNSVQSSKHKIKISGTLKDAINYTDYKLGKGKYVMYSIVMGFLVVFIVCLAQIMMVNIDSPELSLTLLICAGFIFGMYAIRRLLFKESR